MINYIKNIPIGAPYKKIAVSLFLSIFMASGLRWFFIDDDFFKMFPEDLDSRVVWESIVEEFGDSEFLFIAFGKDGKEVFDLDIISKTKELTKEIESIAIVDRVVSLSTIDKIEYDAEDDWINVEKLFNSDELTNKDIVSAKA